MFIFYFGAGINHFRNPGSYYKIMPPYFPQPHLLNMLAGAAEILLAILLLFPKTRRLSAYIIILMLIAFIPVHIYMIETGFCLNETTCLPVWGLWLRLVVLQPLFILWAWSLRNYNTKHV